jgi:N-dimethylarginine dimethylaminohydrolase
MKVVDREYFLCEPSELELFYEINPWMNKEKGFNKQKAIEDWKNLVRVYQQLVPEKVTLVPPEKGLTELCFFGDSVFAIKNKAVYSRFTATERYKETDYVINYLSDLKFEGERVPENIRFEGSGETMLWNNSILVGYGKRSSGEIASYLEKTFDMPVYSFELIDSKYYHLDTALFPVSDKILAVYFPAFSKDSQEKIRSLDAEIIELNLQDAEEFAANSIAIGKDIIVHKGAKNFSNILENKGFTVHPVDMSEFLKFGGGLKCLTFQHYV